MRRMVAIAVAGACGLLTACSSPLVVAVALPQTGDAAVYGKAEQEGVKLAIDAAITSKTLPGDFHVLYRDTGSDPAKAAEAATDLIKEGALAIIGGATDGDARAMIPVIDAEHTVLVSPSAGAPGLAAKSVYFFRMVPSDDLEGSVAARILADTRKATRIVVLNDESQYARDLLPVFLGAFKGRRGDVLATVTMEEPNWGQRLRDVLHALKPEGVYLCAWGQDLVAGLKDLRAAGFGGAICTTSALLAGPILESAGATAEGVLLPLSEFDLEVKKEPVTSFVANFRAAYGHEPDLYAALGYDAAHAVLMAIHDLRTRSGRVIQVRLKGLTATPGVTGLIAFDDQGNIRHYPRAYWIHDGKVEDYEAYLEKLREELLKKARELGFSGIPG
jgi:branched-chain amino acid transport system substrate-binding protein